MSLAFSQVKTVQIQDPVLDVSGEKKYAVIRGPADTLFKVFPATSISPSNVNFTIIPPGPSYFVSREVKHEFPVRLTLTGVVTSNNSTYSPTVYGINPGLDAPRFMALSSAIETLTANINGTTVSINLSDTIHPLLRYNIDSDLKTRNYSSSFSYPDQSFNYSDLIGANRSPLSSYASSLDESPIPRGGGSFTIVSNPSVVASTAGTTFTAVVDFVVSEPLFLSPFYFGKCNSEGFYNINNMQMYYNFVGGGAGFRMWSHDSISPVASMGTNIVTSQITGITWQFSNFTGPAFSYALASPQLVFKFLAPNKLNKFISQETPINYPYFEVRSYAKSYSPITYASAMLPGASTLPLQTDSITLGSIPRRMYIFCRPDNNTLQTRCDLTDSYYPIVSCQLQWGAKSAILNGASQRQLYDISIKNHLDMTWQQWSGSPVYNSSYPVATASKQYGCGGGPLCLEFGTDIPLDADQSPGLAGNWQLQVQVNVQNLNSSGAWDNLPVYLWLVVVYEGIVCIPGSGSMVTQISPLTNADIVNASKSPFVDYYSSQSVNGGNFFNGLKNFGSKINDFLKESKIISTLAPALSLIPGVGPVIGPAATAISKNLGYGHRKGGRLIKRSELMDRNSEY